MKIFDKAGVALKKRLPKTKPGKALAAIALVTVLLVAGVGTAWATGLVAFPRMEAAFRGEGHQARAIVEEPGEGAVLDVGDVIRGHQVGGFGEVYVWVKGVNYPVKVDMSGSGWQYEILSVMSGTRTLVFSVLMNGAWGPTTEVTYGFTGVEGEEKPYVTEDWWGPARAVFQPVERFFRGTVAFVTNLGSSATSEGSGDLDGDGVPDQWQGSPVAPTKTLGGIPYINTAIPVLVIVAVAALAAWRVRDIKDWLLARGINRKQRRIRALELKAKQRMEKEREKTKRAKYQADASSRPVEIQGRVEEKRIQAALEAARVQAASAKELESRRVEVAREAARLQVEQQRLQAGVVNATTAAKKELMKEQLRAKKELLSKKLDAARALKSQQLQAKADALKAQKKALREA